jgi:hypothetical protein
MCFGLTKVLSLYTFCNKAQWSVQQLTVQHWHIFAWPSNENVLDFWKGVLLLHDSAWSHAAMTTNSIYKISAGRYWSILHKTLTWHLVINIIFHHWMNIYEAIGFKWWWHGNRREMMVEQKGHDLLLTENKKIHHTICVSILQGLCQKVLGCLWHYLAHFVSGIVIQKPWTICLINLFLTDPQI